MSGGKKWNAREISVFDNSPRNGWQSERNSSSKQFAVSSFLKKRNFPQATSEYRKSIRMYGVRTRLLTRLQFALEQQQQNKIIYYWSLQSSTCAGFRRSTYTIFCCCYFYYFSLFSTNFHFIIFFLISFHSFRLKHDLCMYCLSNFISFVLFHWIRCTAAAFAECETTL